MPHHVTKYMPLVLCALITAFAFGWSYTFKKVPPMLIQGFQPGAFPRMVATVIIVLAAFGIWRTLKGKEPEEDTSPLPRPFHMTLLALLIVGLLMLTSDFLLALMAGCFGIAYFWGERRPLVLIALGIVAPILVVLFFDTAFQVRFPRGFLINLYYG
ncbi:tripartite tricarboxylate transporter TctB family protein [Paracoccaceae bacterium GXU_MW_L88]